jgi:hypothetical protein
MTGLISTKLHFREMSIAPLPPFSRIEKRFLRIYKRVLMRENDFLARAEIPNAISLLFGDSPEIQRP